MIQQGDFLIINAFEQNRITHYLIGSRKSKNYCYPRIDVATMILIVIY